MSDGISAPDRQLDQYRTSVLLGAGASADAGLPLTSDLAATIVERANRQDQIRRPSPDWVRALNAVYAGMIGYQGARGDNPLSAVNIETLISAIRLLRVRESHEVAPFVATWSPALSNFGTANPPRRAGRDLLKSISNALGSSKIFFEEKRAAQAVAEIAQAAIRPDLKKPFEEAESFILKTLVDILSAHDDVSYFEPLLNLARQQDGGVDVITLNYDLTVESAARNGDVRMNRGIDSWRPGEQLEFPPTNGVLNLMKLHGSLDWHRSPSHDRSHALLAARGICVAEPGEAHKERNRDLPWIVVGDRDKLGTEGPTLDLNFAARTALRRSRHLAVVGYSFGDPHINTIIRDWLAGDSSRTMSILDWRWPHFRHNYYRDETTFRSELVAVYGMRHDLDGNQVHPRVHLVEGRTSEKLHEVLDSRPKPDPDPLILVHVTEGDSSVRLDVTWQGVDLSDARIEARPGDRDGTQGAIREIKLRGSLPIPEAERWQSDLTIESWTTGSTQTVYAPLDVLPIELRVTGASMIGSQEGVALCEVAVTQNQSLDRGSN